MKCNQAQVQLDDYLDRNLSAIQQNALQQHLNSCAQCRRKFDHAHNIQLALLDLPVAKPSSDFSRRAFAFLGSTGARDSRWFTAVGGALAATLALWLVFMATSHQPSSTFEVVKVQVEPNRVQTVSLVFNSASAIDEATMRIELPENLQLAGAPNRRIIEWKTQLKQGRNQLSLPLLATDGRTARLTTRITHDRQSKVFHLDVTPRIPPQSEYSSTHQITI